MFTRETIDDGFALETERLHLRWPRLADAGTIERLAGERAVAEMTALIPHPYPTGAAGAFIFAARLANARGDGLTLAITHRKRPRDLIGVIGLHAPMDAAPHPFVGYWLGTPSWGAGIATEAARAMIDTFFEETAEPAITADVRTTNEASRRVLEKCGLRQHEVALTAFPARGGLFPVRRMRLTREAWQARRAPATTREEAECTQAALAPADLH